MTPLIIRHTEANVNRHTEADLGDALRMGDNLGAGKRFRYYRLQRGFNGKEFAALIGIQGSSLTGLEKGDGERGSKNPAALTLLKAAKVLGLDPWYLLTGQGMPIQAVQHLHEDEVRLLMLYRDLGDRAKQELVTQANRLHREEHSGKPAAAPSKAHIQQIKPKRRGAQ